MKDYYRERVEDVLREVIELYDQARLAIEQLQPDVLETLIVRRMDLLGQLRELSVENYMGRASEGWFLSLSGRVRVAEEEFEHALHSSFAEQRAQMRLVSQANKARKAYNSAA